MLFQISQTLLYSAMDQSKQEAKDDSVPSEEVSVAYCWVFESHSYLVKLVYHQVSS